MQRRRPRTRAATSRKQPRNPTARTPSRARATRSNHKQARTARHTRHQTQSRACRPAFSEHLHVACTAHVYVFCTCSVRVSAVIPTDPDVTFSATARRRGGRWRCKCHFRRLQARCAPNVREALALCAAPRSGAACGSCMARPASCALVKRPNGYGYARLWPFRASRPAPHCLYYCGRYAAARPACPRGRPPRLSVSMRLLCQPAFFRILLECPLRALMAAVFVSWVRGGTVCAWVRGRGGSFARWPLAYVASRDARSPA
jgi:hypothetical protein